MSDILQAARSYYGLADTDVRKTDIYTNEAGQPMLVFELALSAEDFIAIGARMKNMQQPDTEPDTAIIEGPAVEAMREAYNALSKAEKGRYGSFARYMAEGSGGILEQREDSALEEFIMKRARSSPSNRSDEGFMTGDGRQVIHVDAPEEPEPVSMDAVWVKEADATETQKMFASDQDAVAGYYVQWAMLTNEQKQKAKESGK